MTSGNYAASEVAFPRELPEADRGGEVEHRFAVAGLGDDLRLPDIGR
jgi:hypothetical protein